MPFPALVRFVRPRVNAMGFGMVMQVENLHNPLPNRFSLKRLFYGDALDVCSLRPMQFVDHFSKVVDVAHRLIPFILQSNR